MIIYTPLCNLSACLGFQSEGVLLATHFRIFSVPFSEDQAAVSLIHAYHAYAGQKVTALNVSTLSLSSATSSRLSLFRVAIVVYRLVHGEFHFPRHLQRVKTERHTTASAEKNRRVRSPEGKSSPAGRPIVPVPILRSREITGANCLSRYKAS